MRRRPFVMLAGLVLCVVTGCVKQTLTVTSNPPGALVYLNDVEAGRTPFTREFTYYGTYDVALRKDGYDMLKTTGVVVAPWWNWVPFDLVAALFPLHDKQTLHYSLAPAATQPADNAALVARARQLETELPATRPAKP